MTAKFGGTQRSSYSLPGDRPTNAQEGNLGRLGSGFHEDCTVCVARDSAGGAGVPRLGSTVDHLSVS